MDTEIRIARLEERLTWLQRHIVEQDRVISAQSFELESIKLKLATLKKQMPESSQSESTPADERPPHY